MNTSEINSLIVLFKEGDKVHRKLWHDFDFAVEKCPKVVFYKPKTKLDRTTKNKVAINEMQILGSLSTVCEGIEWLNKSWKKRVINQLLDYGHDDLAYRFANAHPIGLGGMPTERIVKCIEDTRDRLYPVSARIYELSHIILEQIEKEYGLNYNNISFPGFKFANYDELFRFQFDEDNEQLLLNGHLVASFKFNSTSYDYFVKGFKNSGSYVHTGKSTTHTISVLVSRYNLPTCVKRAFFSSHGEYIKFNMRLSQQDVIRYCKSSDELAELIKKYS